MKAIDALQEFRKYAATTTHDLSRITGAQALDLMVGFYRDVRAEGCDPLDLADMLSFQCGTYDWGRGEHFTFDVTRQLYRPGAEPNAEGVVEDADDYIWHLDVSLQFEPTAALRALGAYSASCPTPEGIDDFVAQVRGSAAYSLLHSRPDARLVLDYKCVG